MQKDKEIHIYAAHHNKWDRFLYDSIDFYSNLIFESVSWDAESTLWELRKRKKHLSVFNKSKLAVLEKYKKRGTNLIVGDFIEDYKRNNIIKDWNNGLDYDINFLEYSQNLDNIIKFYNKRASVEKIRNENFIKNIESVEWSVLVRVGKSHSVLVKELKRLGYDLSIDILPEVYGYHTALIRKLALWSQASDEEYIRWWCCAMMENNELIRNSLISKNAQEIKEEDWSLFHPFINALIDSYWDNIGDINARNINKLFIEQWLPDPLLKKITKREQKEYLKNFSIKKYGDDKYYQWLIKQGIMTG